MEYYLAVSVQIRHLSGRNSQKYSMMSLQNSKSYQQVELFPAENPRVGSSRMAGFPEPEVGLVISYSYLWKEEEERGQVEGRKDRPCAIVLAIDHPDPEVDGHKQVAVVPITHSPPHDPEVAVEIPPRVKEHLGLDAERSWVILDEVNVFTWPGFVSVAYAPSSTLRSTAGRLPIRVRRAKTTPSVP
jgi:hypothetical protein